MKNTPPRTKRNLKPKPAVTATPVTVTDLTSFDLVGLDGRQLRHFVTKNAIAHVAHGQRIIVRVDVLLEAIDRLASTGAAPKVAADLDDLETPTSAAGVLSLIGRRAS